MLPSLDVTRADVTPFRNTSELIRRSYATGLDGSLVPSRPTQYKASPQTHVFVFFFSRTRASREAESTAVGCFQVTESSVGTSGELSTCIYFVAVADKVHYPPLHSVENGRWKRICSIKGFRNPSGKAAVVEFYWLLALRRQTLCYEANFFIKKERKKNRLASKKI